MRILLVDGNSVASRARWAQKNLTTSDNRRSGVVFGVLQNLGWIRNRLALQRDQVFFIWDGGRSAFRKEKLPTYKSRKAPDDEVEFYEYLAQLDALYQNLNAFGVRGQLKLKGIEADDLISAMAYSVHEGGNTPIVYSTDQDLHQLADVALIFDPVKNMMSKEDILAFHGCARIEQIPLLKALQGDKSDMIPGIEGFGPKRAGIVLPYVLDLFGVAGDNPSLDSASPTVKKWIKKVYDCQEIVRRNLELIQLPKSFDTVRDLRDGQMDEIAKALEHKPDVDYGRIERFLEHWECKSILDFHRF